MARRKVKVLSLAPFICLWVSKDAMHRACLALQVRFAVLEWKAQKTEIGSCSAVDFFYRYWQAVKKVYFCFIIWSATSFSYKFQTWLLKDCLEPMDGEKLCRREGQPPSRANFCERLYEEKTDHFVRVNSACACCLCLALTVLSQLAGRAKVEKY